MTNGTPAPASGNGLSSMLQFGMKAGRWGIAAVFLAGLGELVQFVWPDNTRMDSLTHFCMWTGAGLALIGLQSHAKRATDIAVTVAAEAKIDRALIANAVTPATVTLVPSSSDPAVQREIDKIRESK